MVVRDRDLNRTSFRQSKYQYSEQLHLRLFMIILIYFTQRPQVLPLSAILEPILSCENNTIL